MSFVITRRALLAATAILAISATGALAQDKILLRLSGVNSETDQRAIALTEVFGPAVADFATFEPHWNGTLFQQGTELEAIAAGDLEMSITSAQELATFFPEWSVFAAGYVLQSAEHQVRVFNDPLMDPFKQKVEAELGVRLLAPMYLGRRQVNLRQPRSEIDVKTPADLAGVNLRMPGTDAWQFLGRALGANPTPMAFTEVYTALQTGAVDGQDNPLPTVVDAKFYEVTKQIALTSHLVDWNFIALSAEVYNEMTPEQQEAVTAAAIAAADSGRLEIYEPDVAAFRTAVQEAYLDSEFASSWPEGVLDAVNALGD
jgi:TRAP-type transport system periplasmic protein